MRGIATTAKAWTPRALLGVRLVLGPMLLVAAWNGNAGIGWVLILSAGILSDILDGFVARRLNVATPRLRELDSWVDGWFFICAMTSVWLVRGEVLRPFLTPLVAMIAVYLLSLAAGWLKFGRVAAFHAHSARVAGGLLFFAATQLVVFGRAGWLLWAAIIAAILSHIDRIAMVLVLDRWTHDVPSVWHALRIRNDGRSLPEHIHRAANGNLPQP